MELDRSVFDLEHSLHSLSLSPAGSVHGRKLYRFPSLNLALSLLIDLLRLTSNTRNQDVEMENEHMMKKLVLAPIGKEMRHFAKFIQGCMLQSNNFSWY